jgi:hypothetical protein
MASKYRIVSDGIRFKIHYLSHSCLTGKSKWKVCGRNHPDIGWVSITEYSINDAEQVLRHLKAEDKAKEQGYIVIAEY